LHVINVGETKVNKILKKAKQELSDRFNFYIDLYVYTREKKRQPLWVAMEEE
tara:strand:- start:216 stop:371 length:156 start_codon:yes stop_codon:yes gene_type:complete